MGGLKLQVSWGNGCLVSLVCIPRVALIERLTRSTRTPSDILTHFQLTHYVRLRNLIIRSKRNPPPTSKNECHAHF